MRVGVVGDTHIPEQSLVLPARVAQVLQGVDVILHVGDICELNVLEELQETYTLTFAVWGEADTREVRRYLDEKRVVQLGDRRVGMIHGHQYSRSTDKGWRGLRNLFTQSPKHGSLLDFLVEQFAGEDVDVIVYGHTHDPKVCKHKGVLLFNPGAAMPGQRPSVGILEVDSDRVAGEVVYL